MWRHWLDGIHPELRSTAREVVSDLRPHDYLAALNSSMAFGFNLLLPFRDAGGLSALLSALLGEPVQAEAIHFEWAAPGRVLCEIRGEVPERDEHYTAIDALITARCSGEPVAFLVEVKLSEDGFTPCGGRASRANHHKKICRSATRLFLNPAGCYLRRPWRASRDRRYWSIFAAAHGSLPACFHGVDPAGPCPFSRHGQQPMRQHAMALGSVQDGIFSRTWLVLLHHDDNPDVPGPWESYASCTRDRGMFLRLPASKLLCVHPQGEWLAERYGLSS